MNIDYAKGAGITVGNLHKAGIIHGDLTTSNMIWHDGFVYLIDFGLSQITEEIEPRGVDLHVLFQTLESTTEDPGSLKNAFISGYSATFSEARSVIQREHEIELRGRYL